MPSGSAAQSAIARIDLRLNMYSSLIHNLHMIRIRDIRLTFIKIRDIAIMQTNMVVVNPSVGLFVFMKSVSNLCNLLQRYVRMRDVIWETVISSHEFDG